MKQLMAAVGYHPLGMSELEQNEAEQEGQGSWILPEDFAAVSASATQPSCRGSQVIPTRHGAGDAICALHLWFLAWHHTAWLAELTGSDTPTNGNRNTVFSITSST